jgi:hypothetical protein
MQGWVVGSRTHSGLHPQIRLRVEATRVVEVQGRNHVAEYLREKFEEYKAITYPGFPGPGANWIEETALGTHPAHRSVPGAEKMGWWGQMAAYNGSPRAGVFHLAVGTSNEGETARFARERGLEIQHWDLEFHSPTLLMDGKAIISEGHLTALDNPAVKEVAARFGDPDTLLRMRESPRIP